MIQAFAVAFALLCAYGDAAAPPDAEVACVRKEAVPVGERDMPVGEGEGVAAILPALGDILTFAANGHIAKSDLWPEASRKRSDLPPCVEQHFAAALGREYRAFLTATLMDFWSRSQSLTQGLRGIVTMVPRNAADAPLFVEALTDEPTGAIHP